MFTIEIEKSKVELSKLTNRLKSEAYRLFMATLADAATNLDMQSQTAILKTFASEHYNRISEIFFSAVSVDGKLFLENFESIMDEKTLNFEISVYSACIEHYLGKSLNAVGDNQSGK